MEIEISYADKEITPWGGMVLMRKVLDKLEFGKHIDDCADLPRPGSNRGYDPKTIIESFFGKYLVWGQPLYAHRSNPA